MSLTKGTSPLTCALWTLLLLSLAIGAGLVHNKFSQHGVPLFPKPHAGLQIVDTDHAGFLHKENAQFIDARSPDAFGREHISGAENLDYYNLSDGIDAFAAKHDRSEQLIVYCEGITGDHNEDTCSTSKMLVEELLMRGYAKAMLYEQGIAFWEKAGLPIESGTAPSTAHVTKIPIFNYVRDLAMLLIGIVALLLFRNRPVIAIVKLLLGIVFIVGAMSKLSHIDQLQVIMDAYRILPTAVLPFASACMPLVELTAGVALVTVVFSAPGALLVAGMHLFFIPALSYRAWFLSKQLGVSIFSVNFDCGCGLGENFAWVLILRDVGFLMMAVAVLVASVRIAKAGVAKP